MVWQVRAREVASTAVCALPRPAAYGAARLLGTGAALLPSARRDALRANVAAAHGLPRGHRAVRVDVRRAFQHAFLNYVDLFNLERRDATELIDSIVVDDWGPFERAEALGKGVIMVSAHLGNFDTVVQKLARRGVRTMVPVELIQPPELLDAVRRSRSVLGIAMEPLGPDTFSRLARHLRTGGTVVILCDRDIQGTGYPATMFGRPVRLPHAAVLLSLRTGAPIVGAFGLRHPDNSISARLIEGRIPGSAANTGMRQALGAGMEMLARMIEREIRRDPGQWVVQQPIFTLPVPKRLHRVPQAWARIPRWVLRRGAGV